MRVRQIWHWLYHRGVSEAAHMSTLPAALRDRLGQLCVIARPAVVAEQCSADGTRKWLLRVASGPRDRGRAHPRGRSRRALHLEPGRLQPDLQLLPHRHHAAGGQPRRQPDPGSDPDRPRPARRMAEPQGPAPAQPHRGHGHGRAALELRATAKALRIAMDPDGLAFPARKITLSTSGVVPKIGPWGATSASASRSRCTRCATSCATSWCRSTADGRSRSCSMPAAPIPWPIASPSSTSCWTASTTATPMRASWSA